MRLLRNITIAFGIICLILTWVFATKARVNIPAPYPNTSIEVLKKERKLILYSNGRRIRTYRIGLSRSFSVGDKEKEGDGKTPEGEYFVCSKNPESSFYLSLGLSYPNVKDAERGLQHKLITKRQYKRIVNAIKKKRIPPWDTPLGGEIFIHGDGSKTDWTLGCIALDNEDISELYKAVPVGTPVRIQP